MKSFRSILWPVLLVAAVSWQLVPVSLAQQPKNVQMSQQSGSRGEIIEDLKFGNGRTGSFLAGSTLSIAGTLNGTPTGGTLNLSNLTLTLPASYLSAAQLIAVNGGGVNNGGLVDWSQLMNVPAGFADGSDDGTGGSVSDGDKGDITVSSSGTVWNVDNGVINNAKIAADAAIVLSKLATDPLARANHTGTQSADTITDGTTNKAYTAAEQTKLAGIATGATANSSDATLLSRANHTGTQTMSTISDAGNSATRNVGTTAGTVAAGDDSRITGAVQTTAIDTAAERSTLGFKTTTHGGLDERQDHGAMGATETFDLATANAHIGTLDANLTPTLTGFTSGKFCSMILGLLQNGTGGWTVTWPGAVVSAPTIATAADTITWVTLWSVDGGTTIYASSTSDGGDVSSNTASSVDSELALFSGTGGKTIKRATGSGIAKLTSGVLSVATSGSDYAPATSGSAILKGDGSGGFSNAAAGTDYAPATSGSGMLKGNGSGGFSTATAGADYLTNATRTVTFVLTIDDLADSLNYDIGFVGAAFTVLEIRAVHFGTGLSSPSVVATVKHGTDRTTGTTIEAVTATSSTTGTSVTTGFDDATVPANSFIWVETGSKSGTTDNFTVIVRGTYD